MNTFVVLFAWLFIFGCAAGCGVFAAMLICNRTEGFADGPAPQKLHPAIPIAIFAVLGPILAMRGGTIGQLGIIALLGVPLTGIWYTDARKGIVPDLFTLVPLAVVAVAVLVHRSWMIAASAIFLFVVFAIAAALSKGRGMGWGDAKLAALSGAVLGIESSLLTLALACFAATVVSVIRDKGTKPIAFAPYIVIGMLTALAFSIHA